MATWNDQPLSYHSFPWETDVKIKIWGNSPPRAYVWDNPIEWVKTTSIEAMKRLLEDLAYAEYRRKSLLDTYVTSIKRVFHEKLLGELALTIYEVETESEDTYPKFWLIFINRKSYTLYAEAFESLESAEHDGKIHVERLAKLVIA